MSDAAVNVTFIDHQERTQQEAMDLCKNALGHAWEQIPATSKPLFGVYMIFRCERCGTERRDIVQRESGRLLRRYYLHPEGYTDNKRIRRDDWRAAQINKLGL